MKTFTIWKTITLGDAKPKLKDINISLYAKDMLEKVEYQKKKEKVDLVKVTVGELGFTGWTKYKDVISKAKEFGLELCPAEVGPRLREEYRDQPLGEWITVAMEPLSDPDGDPFVFHVGRSGGGLWLGHSWAAPGSEWDPDYAFVFRLRKSLGHSDTLDSLTLRVQKLEKVTAAATKALKEFAKTFKDLS